MKFEFDKAPEPSKSITVCEGIQWFYMPLPFALDHVNCWLLGEAGKQILIDTGVDNSATRAHWDAAFATIGRLPEGHLVTHFHPDHMGLAGWFESLGCQNFAGSEIEIEHAIAVWKATDQQYVDSYVDWYTSNGLPADIIDTVPRYGNMYRNKSSEPPPVSQWQYLSDGQRITLAGCEYEVIVGKGHAPDMILLYRHDDHVLIAADQVLPSISPNVSVMPGLADQNPLDSFLQSLRRLQALPSDTLVLPSHGLPFRGLHERLLMLLSHHDERLELVLKACSQPRCAYDLFEMLFRRKLDHQQMSFALGESLAHLQYLEHKGALDRLDIDGVTHFAARKV